MKRALNPKKGNNKNKKKNANKHRLKRVKGCDIYVVRLDGAGLGESRPCHLCLEWLRACGVKRVFYSVRPQQQAAAAAQPVGDDDGSPPVAAAGAVRWVKQTLEALCAETQYVTLSERFLSSRATNGRWHEPPNHNH